MVPAILVSGGRELGSGCELLSPQLDMRGSHPVFCKRNVPSMTSMLLMVVLISFNKCYDLKHFWHFNGKIN